MAILTQLSAWIPAASRARDLDTAADLIPAIKAAMARTDEVFGARDASAGQERFTEQCGANRRQMRSRR
jgi:hypothetical protein